MRHNGTLRQWISFTATGGKQNGIHEVLKYYSIDQSETMSLGDGKNDIDMFEYTKISVTIINADDDVKKASRLCHR